MRTLTMLALTLALAVPAASAQQQQQEDKQAAQRREMAQKMRELEQQMRDLQREMSRLEPGTPRVPSRVYTTAPMVQLFGGRAYLGVTVSTAKNPATDSVGAVLEGVSPGGPAEKAGLKAGDVVTAFNGDKLSGRYPAAGDYESEPGRKFIDFARELDEGDTVMVDYRRGKETHRATVVAKRLGGEGFGFSVTTPMPDVVHVEAAPMVALEGLRGAMAWTTGWLDLELVKLNPELGDYFGTTEGLLVIRAPDDSTLPLKGGDVILSVDGRPATNQAQLMRILRSYEAGEEVKIDIMRQKRRTTLTVKIPDRRVHRNGLNYDFDWER